MRASDLIGRDVHDAGGHHLGIVTDLRCIQDGPLRGSMQSPRITALIVSRRNTGSLLGYDRHQQQGPWLIRTIVQRLHRHAVLVPWDSLKNPTTSAAFVLSAGAAAPEPLRN
jgi:sporulation protein YlmC with PRC-barrel domain